MLFVEVQDASQIPALAEPWFLSLQASIEMDVRPTFTSLVQKLTVSPTKTGWWNSTLFIATETNGWSGHPALRTSWCAPTAPAMSIWLSRTPPKIVP